MEPGNAQTQEVQADNPGKRYVVRAVVAADPVDTGGQGMVVSTAPAYDRAAEWVDLHRVKPPRHPYRAVPALERRLVELVRLGGVLDAVVADPVTGEVWDGLDRYFLAVAMELPQIKVAWLARGTELPPPAQAVRYSGYRDWQKVVRDLTISLLPAGVRSISNVVTEAGSLRQLLRAKLSEEAAEAYSAETDTALLNELADVAEVLQAVARLYGWTPADIEAARLEKRRRLGGFDAGVYLHATDDRPLDDIESVFGPKIIHTVTA